MVVAVGESAGVMFALLIGHRSRFGNAAERQREREREREGERIISRNTILSSLLSVTHAANRGERERERGVYEREKLRRGRKNEDRKHFQSVN